MLYQFQHFGASEYFCKEYGENFSYPVHLHHSFEFITVVSGEMEVTVDNKVYTLNKGESVFVFPNQMHSLSSKNSEHMLCIFSPELVRSYAKKVSDKIPIENKVLFDPYIIDALDNLLPESSTVEKKGILYSLCGGFDKNAEYKKKTDFDEDLLYKIFRFVEENYSKDCSLISLSEKTGYSYSYLSRCFKQTTGISFNAYVNRFRLSNACYLLDNSNCSVLQCALDSGYKSLRSFNRNFISFLSVTPTQFRERFKNNDN